MSTRNHRRTVVEDIDIGIDIGIIEDGSFSEEQREFLRNRWLHEVWWFTKATRRSRRLYQAAGVIAVISGAATATMAGLGASLPESWMRWLTVGFAAITATSTGFAARFQDWENWKRRSLTLERLKSEGRMFLLLAGPYKEFGTQKEAFKSFAEKLDSIIKEHKTEFFAKKPEEAQTAAF